MLRKLSDLELLILEHLPGTPNGLSIWELADGLLGNAGPKARGDVKLALWTLDGCLGGLAVTRGDDYMGHCDVELWGLPADTRSVLIRVFAQR